VKRMILLLPVTLFAAVVQAQQTLTVPGGQQPLATPSVKPAPGSTIICVPHEDGSWTVMMNGHVRTAPNFQAMQAAVSDMHQGEDSWQR
jgi:hypothetical protein